MKLWEKKAKLNKQVEKFTVGNDYLLDQKLVKYDCTASIAHAKMLCKIGVLSKGEEKKLKAGLEEIIKLDKKGKFKIKQEEEDCHTAIENYLVGKLGAAGKKIHTARSRNDQVLAALHLYCKEEIVAIEKLINNFSASIKAFKKKYGNIKLPGYTHMRKAMPSSIGLWSGAFIEALEDDKKLLLCAKGLLDSSPLGTGAGYGLPIEVNRKFTAKLLGFKYVQKNALYVQNSRGKIESALLHSLGSIMFDLNKISSDLILFSMPEFGFFELPTDFCTGSSIMPQKQNPDLLEIIRAKYHKLLALEFQIKSTIGNLPSGYNRDLQLTKEPLMEGIDTTKDCLYIMSLLFKKLSVNSENCKKALTEELYATEKAYKLVKAGIPFREAYKTVSKEIFPDA